MARLGAVRAEGEKAAALARPQQTGRSAKAARRRPSDTAKFLVAEETEAEAVNGFWFSQSNVQANRDSPCSKYNRLMCLSREKLQIIVANQNSLPGTTPYSAEK